MASSLTHSLNGCPLSCQFDELTYSVSNFHQYSRRPNICRDLSIILNLSLINHYIAFFKFAAQGERSSDIALVPSSILVILVGSGLGKPSKKKKKV